jgi:predicted  nucleic acid-binding Zn-ribbon protein
LDLQEIKSRIFKGKDGWNNYMNVSIEEMDWLVKQAEKVEEHDSFMNELVSKLDYTLNLVIKRHNEYVKLQEENEQIKEAYKDREDDIEFYLNMLREIDTHIRSDKNPISYIVNTLKGCLPEYQIDFD